MAPWQYKFLANFLYHNEVKQVFDFFLSSYTSQSSIDPKIIMRDDRSIFLWFSSYALFINNLFLWYVMDLFIISVHTYIYFFIPKKNPIYVDSNDYCELIVIFVRGVFL